MHDVPSTPSLGGGRPPDDGKAEGPCLKFCHDYDGEHEDDGCLQFEQRVERGEGIGMDPLDDVPAQISVEGTRTRFDQTAPASHLCTPTTNRGQHWVAYVYGDVEGYSVYHIPVKRSTLDVDQQL